MKAVLLLGLLAILQCLFLGFTVNRIALPDLKVEKGEGRALRALVADPDLKKNEIEQIEELQREVESGKLDVFKKPTSLYVPSPGAIKAPHDDYTLSRLLKDPVAGRLIWENARNSLDQDYKDLFSTLSLKSVDEARLRDLLADLEVSKDDLRSIYNPAGKVVPNDAYIKATGETYAEIKKLLGSEQFGLLIAHATLVPARNEITAITDKFVSTSFALSGSEVEALSKIWLESAGKLTKSADTYMPRSFAPVDSDYIVQRASEVLSEDKMRVLVKYLANRPRS